MAGRRQQAPEDPQRFHLRLFGGFVLTRHDVPEPLTRSGQRLLALLALQPSHDRLAVAATLWSEASEAHALGSLRSTLWRLRRQGLHLETADGGVCLPSGCASDVDELQRLLCSGSHTQPGDRVPPWLLDQAVLLPGWYDDWVLVDRERLRQLRLQVGESCAEHLCGQGRYGLALQVAMAVLVCEPLRESAQRLIIRIHLAQGNVAEAARQYGQCCALLRDELGLGPSELLRGLGELLPPQVRRRYEVGSPVTRS